MKENLKFTAIMLGAIPLGYGVLLIFVWFYALILPPRFATPTLKQHRLPPATLCETECEP